MKTTEEQLAKIVEILETIKGDVKYIAVFLIISLSLITLKILNII